MGKFKVGDKVRVRRLKDMFCDPDIKVLFYRNEVNELRDPELLCFVKQMFPIAGTVVRVKEDVSGNLDVFGHVIMEKYICDCKNDTRWYFTPFFLENEVVDSG